MSSISEFESKNNFVKPKPIHCVEFCYIASCVCAATGGILRAQVGRAVLSHAACAEPRDVLSHAALQLARGSVDDCHVEVSGFEFFAYRSRDIANVEY